MVITPEMARAELRRRRGLSTSQGSITPEMARAELQRRRSLIQEPIHENSQEEGFIDYAKRGLARGARNAVVGALDSLDFLATPVREGLNLGAKALGIEKRIKPLGEEIAKGIDTGTGGYTAPRNESEKTSEAIGRALGSIPSGFGLGTALGSAKHLPKVAENVIPAVGNFLRGSNVVTPSNIAGTAATSGLIQSSLNENPENVAGALGSGLLGGVGANAGIGLLSQLTGKGRQATAGRLGEFFKINPSAVETFQEAGVTPLLADVSKGKISKLLTSKLEKTPFASEPIREAKELQRRQILEGLGQSNQENILSRSEIGKLGVKGAKAYQKSKQNEFGQKFTKFDEDIAKLGDDSIDFKNTDEFFEKVLKNIKTSSQEKRFKNSPLGKIYADLYETASKHKGKLPYHDVKERLDEINDMITTHGMIGKVSQGKLKQFSSVLSKDIESSLEPKFKDLGGDAYKNWKEVRKEYASFAQNDIPKLNELYKKDKKGAVDAFLDIMQNQKKGGEKAKIALEGLSHPEQISFVDSLNKQLGATSDGSFSPLVWVRKYKSLEPESKKILLSPLTASSRKKIDHITDSIDRIKETLAEINTSGSGHHVAIGALWTAATAAAVSLVAGNPIPAATLATGLFMGNRVSEKMLTNPKFINWLYKGIKAKDFNHFQRNLNRVPNVGKLNRSLKTAVQTFQNDINKVREERTDNDKS